MRWYSRWFGLAGLCVVLAAVCYVGGPLAAKREAEQRSREQAESNRAVERAEHRVADPEQLAREHLAQGYFYQDAAKRHAEMIALLVPLLALSFFFFCLGLVMVRVRQRVSRHAPGLKSV